MVIRYIRFEPKQPVKKVAPKDAEPQETKRGRPPSGKDLVTIRLDAALLAYYRSLGKGWQSVLNNDLKDHLKKRGIL